MACLKNGKELRVYTQCIIVFHVVHFMNIMKAILALTKKIFQYPKKRNETKTLYIKAWKINVQYIKKRNEYNVQ